MNSQKNEISKNLKSQKRNENKNFSELKNLRTQSMSVSDNVCLRQCQDIGNVRMT